MFLVPQFKRTEKNHCVTMLSCGNDFNCVYECPFHITKEQSGIKATLIKRLLKKNVIIMCLRTNPAY